MNDLYLTHKCVTNDMNQLINPQDISFLQLQGSSL